MPATAKRNTNNLEREKNRDASWYNLPWIYWPWLQFGLLGALLFFCYPWRHEITKFLLIKCLVLVRYFIEWVVISVINTIIRMWNFLVSTPAILETLSKESTKDVSKFLGY